MVGGYQQAGREIQNTRSRGLSGTLVHGQPKGVVIVEGISDIRIISLDEKRPPRIRKEPYIDLYFKLSHKVPKDWCNDFNALLSKHPSKPRINEKEGLFIETWVRSPDDIAALLEQLKGKIVECSRQYIERIALSVSKANDDSASLGVEDSGEQGRLNKIIATLIFDDIKTQ